MANELSELVRYDPVYSDFSAFMIKGKKGEYVLYDQAAAVIAAEKSIRKQTQERLEQSESELKVLRAELAKIKKQKPETKL